MKEIVFASTNLHKMQEIQKVLKNFPYTILPQSQFSDIPEAIENGKNFQENSKIKALNAYHYTKKPSLADDSGLSVHGLNNFPGIYTARFAKEKGGHIPAMQDIIEKLKNNPNKSAHFSCCITLVVDENHIYSFLGTMQGTISFHLKGMGGFGYDPFFIPKGYLNTVAELPSTLKNTISHRAKALNKMQHFLTTHPYILK